MSSDGHRMMSRGGGCDSSGSGVREDSITKAGDDDSARLSFAELMLRQLSSLFFISHGASRSTRQQVMRRSVVTGQRSDPELGHKQHKAHGTMHSTQYTMHNTQCTVGNVFA